MEFTLSKNHGNLRPSDWAEEVMTVTLLEELAEAEQVLLRRDFLFDDPEAYREAVAEALRELRARFASVRVSA